ncbi:ABC transporter ATP-binding protein [Lichenibacterium ramalinae]|uniref:ABC transporter ATP-binding protein n=1 Tax=Lichenibacterium ramalinae TaxID=2316527 RepID=A0A4Q2R9N4_9HYPH|nr:ABC transporter ATP-binding protein [Lichenibacterium ramalinae]RYB01558.1 ABC transporter ATP-binding protein [Lichenibacterium ramalinae]
MTGATPPLLAVQGLTIDARTPAGLKRVLDGIDFTLGREETLCLAGESGSGKSLTALALMRLLPAASLRVAGGSIRLDGCELAGLSERAFRPLRGRDIAMVFQEPMTSLNPVMTVGAQLMESIRAYGRESGDARGRARDALDAVQISDPARRLGQYPHELSGGMRQRVMIAMALARRPKVLIADEPTTALDVTVQAEILRLMRDLRRDFATSILLITHDMGVVAEMADRVAVMRAGRIVEQGPVLDVFERPREATTRELLAAVPRLGALRGTDGPPRLGPATAKPSAPAAEPVPALVVHDLSVTYGAGGWFRRGALAPAVAGVCFDLAPGQTLGLVGESGSGKSTTGKAVLGLVPFTGHVAVDGTAIAGLSARDMKPVRRRAQMIFQDPYASLDPRMTAGDAIAEPLAIHGIGCRAERRDRVAELLRRVHLPPEHASRFPHEFSGGQRQRLCIARALALEPTLIVADESVSALDATVRARVLDLLLELQEELGLAFLFISHDMAVVERMSHRVAVMRSGRIVESGSRREVFETPRDPYTRALLDAVPQRLSPTCTRSTGNTTPFTIT